VKASRRRFPHRTSRYCQVAVRPKRAVCNRSVEGVEPLGRWKLRQIDLEAWPSVTALGRDYIRLIHGPGASTCFHFHTELGLLPPRRAQKSESAAELRSAAAAPAHANEVAGDL
jgi:hypothetical protein